MRTEEWAWWEETQKTWKWDPGSNFWYMDIPDGPGVKTLYFHCRGAGSILAEGTKIPHAVLFCCCSVAKSCLTLCKPMGHSTPGSPVLHHLLEFGKLTSIESVVPSNHLILCRPLLLSPSTFPSIRAFSNELVLSIRWPKYWSLSFSISPSNEYPELISFRMDWCDLLAVQGTLKSLLQHHNLKASILWHSAFFMVQLLHPYVTTGNINNNNNNFW